MFPRKTRTRLRNPQRGNDFADIWGSLLQTVVQVGGQVYTAGQARDIEESKLAFEREQAAANAEIERTRLAIQQKQAELLAQANEKPSLLSGASAGGFSLTDTKSLAILGGVSLGVGVIAYLLFKK